MITLDKDRKAAMAVFRSVNGGLNQGYYFVLHYRGFSVGNINHSKDTLKNIKDTISGVLRSKVKKVLSAPLPCTGNPMPVSELFDKMTHCHQTGQMQMIVAPSFNERIIHCSLS